METILVVPLTNHRLDVMLSNWLCLALDELNIKYTTNIHSSYTKAIVFNGVYDTDAKAKLNVIKGKAKTIFYMFDDCDLLIPDGVKVVTQFKNISGIYFNIASLAIMDYKWDNPINKYKLFYSLYGGTFKSRRDYSIISDKPDTVILGDDEGWDSIFKKSTRLPTIRDMGIFYNLLSLARYTYIVSDPMHDNLNIPLRLFECVFTNTKCIMYTGEVITPEDTKETYTKENLLKEIQCLIQQM